MNTQIDAPTARLISRRAICATIDAAERSFRECWSTLVSLRGGAQSPNPIDGVLTFQSTLIESLAQIETQRVAIKREERRLIGRKATYRPTWFAKRMATLSGYEKALRQTLAIGRAIGDGFAWIFYERDGALVAEHLKRERQISVPLGVGGQGERSSAKNLRALGGKLAIYHGTTTFLRIGDVSLIDLSTMKVCGIGEMKSERVDDTQIEVRIDLIVDAEAVRPFLAETPRRAGPQRQLPPKMHHRFERQRKTMRTALRAANEARSDRRIGRQGEFHHAILDDLVERCGWRRFTYVAPEPSLVLGALRNRRGRSLSQNLLGKSGDIAAKVLGVESLVIAAMSPAHRENAIYLGSIGDPERLIQTSDGIPFTLWDAADATIEALLFGDVIVTTLFNPGHFWREIEERGFELRRPRPDAPLRASRKNNGRFTRLENYEYFLHLIPGQLMSLSAVLSMVDAILKTAEDPSFEVGTRINLRPQIVRSRTAAGVEYDDL